MRPFLTADLLLGSTFDAVFTSCLVDDLYKIPPIITKFAPLDRCGLCRICDASDLGLRSILNLHTEKQSAILSQYLLKPFAFCFFFPLFFPQVLFQCPSLTLTDCFVSVFVATLWQELLKYILSSVVFCEQH